MTDAADVQALIERLEAPRVKTRILGDSYIMDDADMRAEAATALRSLQSRITALEAERDAAVRKRDIWETLAHRVAAHLSLSRQAIDEIYTALKDARSDGPTPPQSETVTPHTASDDVVQEIARILGGETSRDAGYNLDGVLSDMLAGRADDVCVATLQRVGEQLAKVYAVIERFKQGGE